MLRKILNGKFYNKRQVVKQRTRWEDFFPEGHVMDSRNARLEETSRRQRRMETSYEEGRGPEGAVVP